MSRLFVAVSCTPLALRSASSNLQGEVPMRFTLHPVWGFKLSSVACFLHLFPNKIAGLSCQSGCEGSSSSEELSTVSVLDSSSFARWLLLFLCLFLVNETSCWLACLLRLALTRPCNCLSICFYTSLLICGLLGSRATLTFTPPLQWCCGSAVCQSLHSGGCSSF